VPIPTYKLEVELGGKNAGWTNIWPDVRVADGVELEYGIRAGGPLDRVADTGTLSFTLDNSAGNSGSTLGWYSPAHMSKRSGWGVGIRVRFTIINPYDDDKPYCKFVGWLSEILPEPGQHLGRAVRCSEVPR
jgi:hypothetical protein